MINVPHTSHTDMKLASLFVRAAVVIACVAAGLAASASDRVNESRYSGATNGEDAGMTLLANGRTLVAGGTSHRASCEAELRGTAGSVTRLRGLNLCRAHHTVTTLPDGRVMILGGIDEHRFLVARPEVFDADTGVFELAEGAWPRARAGHTVTVLTDGRLLITGGWHPELGNLYEAELFDWRKGKSELLVAELHPPRAGHRAMLLADGRVLILGGHDEQGRQYHRASLFEPDKVRFLDVDSSHAQAHIEAQRLSAPALAASIPTHETTNFAVDGLIALRFTKPLATDSLNRSTVTLFGPVGAADVDVVGTEGGMLAFVSPKQQLLPGSRYTLFVNGAVDKARTPIPFAAIGFQTEVLGVSVDTPRDAAPLSADANVVVSAVVGDHDGEEASSASANRLQGEASEDVNAQSSGKATSADDDDDWTPTAANNGKRWRSGRAHPPKLLPPYISALRGAGGTRLAGQVLRLDGKGLSKVTVSVGSVKAETDKDGWFLLESPAAGKQQLVVDARTANGGGRAYGVHIMQVVIQGNSLNELDHLVWVPKIRGKDRFTIPSPTGTNMILQHRDIPGLEIHIPRGAVIRDREGKIVTEISITPIPIDQAPFPVAEDFPVYFSIQPGGAVVQGLSAATGGIRIIYPNTTDAKPNELVDLFDYDPADKGWFVYGHGRVSADGKQIVPEPGAAQYTTMAVSYVMNGAPGDDGPPSCGGEGTATVDCATGYERMRRTDVVISDLLPLRFERHCRSRDTAFRPFGQGCTHSYDIHLFNPNNSAPSTTDPLFYAKVGLVLPDGRSIYFDNQNVGAVGWPAGRWVHTNEPSEFHQATIVYVAAFTRFELRMKDGSAYYFHYNSGNYLRAYVDRLGNTLTFTRDGSGRLGRVTSQSGRYLSFTYDIGSRVQQITDSNGRTHSYGYDATSGRLNRWTDPAGNFEEYGYDANGNLNLMKDRRGTTLASLVYDANNRVMQETHADGTFVLFAYTLSANGKVIQTDMTDNRGFVTRKTFNSEGHLLSITRGFGTALAQTTTYTRLAGTNHIASMTDALGRRTDYTYDAKGNMLTVTRLAGTANAVTETMTYTADYNQIATRKDPLNKITTYTYDSLGRVTQISDPLNNLTKFTYNAAGQILTITDPRNQVTTFTYDLHDLRTITDPLNRTTTIFTDSLGRTAAVTDPLGNRSTYEYDSLDRQVKMTDALGQITTMTYDANGNLLTVADPNGGTTTYTYDSRDRRASRKDALLNTETFAYDGNGNLTNMVDRKSQTSTYTYDALNRRTQATYADASTTTFTFDAGNRTTQIVDTLSGTITRTYDGLNRMTSETTPQGTVSYTYDAASRRTGMTVGGQTAITYAYDNADRLTGITQGASTVNYTYDAASRRTKLTLANGIDVVYTYDNANQLTKIEYKNGVTLLGDLIYTYDNAGRRTATTGSYARTTLPAATTANAAYNLANQLTSWNSQTLPYDLNGNLATDPTNGNKTYVWDARNRLKEVKQGATTVATFQYDPLGRRTSKVVNGTTTNFVYDGLNPVQERDQTNAIKADLLTGLGIDEFLRRTENPGTTPTPRHFMSDALNSTIALARDDKTLATTYTYEAYGEASSTGEVNSNPYQYTGRENDGTGLYYYRARYYNPVMKHWTAEDPIGLEGGLNTYGYVRSSPLRYTDALGLAPGDSFNSECDAARDFRNFLDQHKDADLYEYGASIYRTRNGTYSYTGVQTDFSRSSVAISSRVPRGSRYTGNVHTHPWGPAGPSPYDIRYYDEYGVNGYVVYQGKDIYYYRPQPLLPKQGKCGCD